LAQELIMRRSIAAILAVFNGTNGLLMLFAAIYIVRNPDKLRRAPDAAPGHFLN
jgi:hypothetical protein